jgi:phosphoribosyl-ATP pyrophosphohydrolase/phosphoribosyl-AMP cyclohydrolase
MIIPSIDIMDGQAVQLIGGKEKALDGGDPLEVAERFAVAGELAVIDLDAALGRGDNSEIIRELVKRYRCRVGGGIRSLDKALDWLDAGAEWIIVGTAAKPELLGQLPRNRVMAALDGVDGELVVEGWQTKAGVNVADRIGELTPLVGGFLITFVEREGRLGGTDLAQAKTLCDLVKAASSEPTIVTIAGGVTTSEEIAALDELGADAQVGMAIYTGKLGLGESVAAPLKSDRADGLIPTVVCDELGVALGLVYSSRESIAAAVDKREGIYYSRSRQEIWEKGKTSGNTQQLIAVELDCDRDAVRFRVRQKGGGFCHLPQRSCFGKDEGFGALERRLRDRLHNAVAGSYTRRLLDDPELLAAKLAEEAGELAEARGEANVAWEVADVLYFATVAMVRAGVSFEDVLAELGLRQRRIRRRRGDAKKPKATAKPEESA